jgi:AcrR family transcriptional regulator
VPRTPGAKNRDYEEKRHALALQLAPHLVDADGEPATLRDLARAAGVTEPTLKHYFTDREGVIHAAIEAVSRGGDAYTTTLDRADAPPEVTLRRIAGGFVEAFRDYGLGRIFAGALSLSLQREKRGPDFVNLLLEPSLQAAERLLAAHAEKGELHVPDPRVSALQLLSPVVLALLHQDSLSGNRCRPLEMGAFLDAHLATYLRGHAP